MEMTNIDKRLSIRIYDADDNQVSQVEPNEFPIAGIGEYLKTGMLIVDCPEELEDDMARLFFQAVGPTLVTGTIGSLAQVRQWGEGTFTIRVAWLSDVVCESTVQVRTDTNPGPLVSFCNEDARFDWPQAEADEGTFQRLMADRPDLIAMVSLLTNLANEEMVSLLKLVTRPVDDE